MGPEGREDRPWSRQGLGEAGQEKLCGTPSLIGSSPLESSWCWAGSLFFPATLLPGPTLEEAELGWGVGEC